MMVVMAALMLIVIVVMMMVMAALMFIVFVVMVMLMLMGKLFHCTLQAVLFHRRLDLLAGNGIPWCGDQPAGRIERTQQFSCSKCFCLINRPCTAENKQIGILNLVIEKLAEVAHIDFAFAGIYHRHPGADFNTIHGSHSSCHVGELSYA